MNVQFLSFLKNVTLKVARLPYRGLPNFGFSRYLYRFFLFFFVTRVFTELTG